MGGGKADRAPKGAIGFCRDAAYRLRARVRREIGRRRRRDQQGERDMPVKVAINGFGRIGRLVLRGIIESGRTDVEVAAINDLGSVEANAHLLRYDSVHGRFPGEVQVEGDTITIRHNGRSYAPIKVSAERDPTKVPYQGIDVAMECTGIFTKKEAAAQLITAGARKVLVSAPADGVDATIVFGVNESTITSDMTVISNASCTTNCLAPMAKVLDDAIGIERGYMVTIHSYTGDQKTVDTFHKDLHRARAAALSMIPTSTGAARAVGLVLPKLKGKLDGTAIRVPTPNVSLVSLDIVPARVPGSVEEVNALFKDAAAGAMKHIMVYSTDPLVSSDFNHVPASCSFDATQTALIDGGKLVRVCGWYDNEWGFSNRMADTAAVFGAL
jgi:glyceraldehyde 3-phosphate dehydrogenase